MLHDVFTTYSPASRASHLRSLFKPLHLSIVPFVPSMKSLLALFAAAAAASLLAFAQSAGPAPAAGSAPPPNANGSYVPPASTAPAASSVPLPGQPAGPSLEKNLPLMPETTPSGATRGGKSGKSKKTGAAHAHASPGASPHGTFDVEQDIRLHIRIVQAQTRALSDPGIQADWVAAHQTRNDPARRAALTVYFNHLYDRMIQLDPSIADLANARRQTAIVRMHYARLGDIVPEDDPYATPAPAASGKNPPLNEESPLP